MCHNNLHYGKCYQVSLDQRGLVHRYEGLTAGRWDPYNARIRLNQVSNFVMSEVVTTLSR